MCGSKRAGVGHLDSGVKMQTETADRVVYDAILAFATAHANTSDFASESRLRHASEDSCGVFYSIMYGRDAGQQEATVTVRTSWPHGLCSHIRLKELMPKLVKEGPATINLASVTTTSCIISWPLDASGAVSAQAMEVVAWLANLRCST